MATGPKDLELALLIKANAEQARAELAATQAQLKGVEDTAKSAGATSAAGVAQLTGAAEQATAAVAGTAEGMAASAAATEQVGETAEQASARIHAMVQSSLAAVDAERARAQSAIEAATATRAAADADGAQVKSTAELVAAQNAQMAVTSRVVAAQAEIAAALEAKSLTEEQSLEVENTINRARAAGLITAAEERDAIAKLVAIKTLDVKVTQDETKANVENAVSRKGMSSRTTYTLSALVDDAASGQFSRSKRELAAFANETGLLGKLMSPVGLAIGGVVAALGALAVAFVKGQTESAAFNRALVSTGAAGTTTAGQLVDMANQVGASTGRYGDAVTALTDLANTGKYTANQLQGLTQTAVDFATITGGKVAAGVKFVDGVMSGNIGTLQKLDEQYHFLTASQFDEIQRLIDQGQQEQATAIAQQAASKAVHDRAQEVQDNAGIMIRAWDGVKNAASAAWNAMKDVGATHSIGQQLKDAMADLQQAKGTHLDRAGNMVQNASPEAIAALNAKINDLRQQLVAQGWEQTQKAVNDNAETKSKAALAALDKFKTPLEVFQNATKKAKQELDDAMLGKLTSDEIARAKMHYQQALDQAQKAYDSATKQHGAKGPKGPNLEALGANAQVAAVKNQLAELSNAWQNTERVLSAQHRAGKLSDQDYFDTLRKDLDTYTQQRIAALEQEKQAATAHLKTAADRIRADQKVAAIDAEITKTRQDGVAKRKEIDAQEQQSIEKSRHEWEQLRRSFETPAEVRVEDAIAQIEKLNKALANGVITAQQYHDALQKIGQKAVAGALPSYRGVSGAVGGPYGELEKNFRAEQALTAAYEAQKLALKRKFNDQDTAQEQAHQAALAALDAQYAQKRNIIEQSRQQLYLTGTEQFFGQLAQLSSSKNKTLATIGKAASIASTLIKAYQSGTEARAALSGIPYIGPALGIAAEAAAIAAGLANVAQMRAQNVTSGYAQGGYTGAGAVHQVAGVVHAGEVVYSQADVARHGGVAAVEAHRLRGYADGGFVHPLANAPSPAELGFTLPASPSMDIRKLAAANDSAAAARAPNVKVVAVWDREQAAHEVLNTPTGHKVIVQTVGDNPRAIQGKWQAG